MVGVDNEVTVIFTTHTSPMGVPVMLKLLVDWVLLWSAVKNATELPSGSAEILISTPLAGMVDVIVTVRLKGPGAAATVVPFAGLVVTVKVGSGVLFFDPQARVKQIITPASTGKNRLFIIDEVFDRNKDKEKWAIIL